MASSRGVKPGSGSPVWRVELQFRRAALGDFQTKTVDEVIATVQDLLALRDSQVAVAAGPDR